MRTKIAVISDIHGNSWALQSVLDDIWNQDVDCIFNLGDSFYGPLDPAGTMNLLLNEKIISICGNQDRLIIQQDASNTSSTMEYVKNSLNTEATSWIRALKKTAIWSDKVFLCHGTPAEDDVYLIEKITSDGAKIRTSAELLTELQRINHQIILCGHSHMPRIINLPGNKMVVNPGSVGLQAYQDDLPHPHVMETGSCHARYCLITEQHTAWRSELKTVPYDWEAAAKCAKMNERLDWARWIATGRA